MGTEVMCDYLGIRVDSEQLTAMQFLESRGQRFCCEFGYENAVQKADDLFDEECGALVRSLKDNGLTWRAHSSNWKTSIN